MRPDRNAPKDIECCLEAVVANLREQHELAKLLDEGPFRPATLMLLECSLYAYRFVAAKRRNGCSSNFPSL